MPPAQKLTKRPLPRGRRPGKFKNEETRARALGHAFRTLISADVIHTICGKNIRPLLHCGQIKVVSWRSPRTKKVSVSRAIQLLSFSDISVNTNGTISFKSVPQMRDIVRTVLNPILQSDQAPFDEAKAIIMSSAAFQSSERVRQTGIVGGDDSGSPINNQSTYASPRLSMKQNSDVRRHQKGIYIEAGFDESARIEEEILDEGKESSDDSDHMESNSPATLFTKSDHFENVLRRQHQTVTKKPQDRSRKNIERKYPLRDRLRKSATTTRSPNTRRVGPETDLHDDESSNNLEGERKVNEFSNAESSEAERRTNNIADDEVDEEATSLGHSKKRLSDQNSLPVTVVPKRSRGQAPEHVHSVVPSTSVQLGIVEPAQVTEQAQILQRKLTISRSEISPDSDGTNFVEGQPDTAEVEGTEASADDDVGVDGSSRIKNRNRNINTLTSTNSDGNLQGGTSTSHVEENDVNDSLTRDRDNGSHAQEDLVPPEFLKSYIIQSAHTIAWLQYFCAKNLIQQDPQNDSNR